MVDAVLFALDEVNQATLGTRPTMSHVTAREEVQRLIDAMRLRAPTAANP